MSKTERTFEQILCEQAETDLKKKQAELAARLAENKSQAKWLVQASKKAELELANARRIGKILEKIERGELPVTFSGT